MREKLLADISLIFKSKAKKDREILNTIVTFEHFEKQDREQLIQLIKKIHSLALDRCPIIWNSGDKLYCKFSSSEEKESFIGLLKVKKSAYYLRKLLTNPPTKGIYFNREPIKVLITSEAESVMLAQLAYKFLLEEAPSECLLEPIEENICNLKKMLDQRLKCVIRANAAGIKHILCRKSETFNDFTKVEHILKFRVSLSVDIVPCTCRKRWKYEKSSDRRRGCTICGSHGHYSKTCQNASRIREICSRAGHFSKDPIYSRYLYSLKKDLKDADIPLECLDEEEMRRNFVSLLLPE